MAKVHDVAAYIIFRLRSVDAMKLQKLLYYSQAWSLVWDSRPLFPLKSRRGLTVRCSRGLQAYQGQYKVSEARYGIRTR